MEVVPVLKLAGEHFWGNIPNHQWYGLTVAENSKALSKLREQIMVIDW